MSQTDHREPAVHRLSTLSPLGADELSALDQALRGRRTTHARREISFTPSRQQPMLIVSGWAARLRLLADGRRQILQLALPGDVMRFNGSSSRQAPTLLAMTTVETCSAPHATEHGALPGLARAYEASRELEEEWLLRQITRLGRLSAYERLIDWLLELRERLALAGLCDGERMPMPLTQEAIADTLGLTSVHVNRTLQAMRRDGLLDAKGGTINWRERATCMSLVEQRQVIPY